MKKILRKFSTLITFVLIFTLPNPMYVILAEESSSNDNTDIEQLNELSNETRSEIDPDYEIKDVDYNAEINNGEYPIYSKINGEILQTTKEFSGHMVSVNKEAILEDNVMVQITLNDNLMGWVSLEALNEVTEDLEESMDNNNNEEQIEENVEETVENLTYHSETSSNMVNVISQPELVYSAYVKGLNWGDEKSAEEISGTVGQKVPIQGIKISINNLDELNIRYSTHVQSYGWTDWVNDGDISGRLLDDKRVEAIKIELTGAQKNNFDIYYRTHTQTYGWLGWAKNGEPAGTEALAKQVEAYEVLLVEKDVNHPRVDRSTQPFITDQTPIVEENLPVIKYSTHVQSNGWLTPVTNPTLSGTIGESKRVEAFRAIVENTEEVNIRYRSKTQTKDWTDWSTNNHLSGTVGESLPLEALRVELTGQKSEQYDVYYRVHVQSFGWLDWAKNGENAGTIGHDKQIEAVELQLVEKGTNFNGSTEKPYVEKITVTYATSVHGAGWQSSVKDGKPSGTTGKKLSMTGLRLQTQNTGLNIEYASHVQSYGWMDWVSDNEISGSKDLTKRLEAVKIRLTGSEAIKYDVFYRLHTESFGWLGWAKNGEAAGTEGYGFRAEAIEVKILPKGSMTTNPNSAIKVFTDPTISYSTHIQKDGWLNSVSNGQMGGTTGESKRLEALRINLLDKPFDGSIVYKSYVRGDGWTSKVNEGLPTGTIGKGKELEAISINLTGQMAKRYDVYYRVHAQSYGWLGWAKNGMNAGTRGRNKQLEAVEIKLVKKGSGPAVDPNESYIEKLLIFLDPGHGGIPRTGGNPGPVYNGVREQDLNLNIAVQVKERLESLGYQVVMSRENDLNSYFPKWQDDLYARPAHANELKADIFVSIHHNAHPSSRATNGIETYYYGTNPNHSPLPENEDSHDDPHRISESRRLANAIHKELIKNTGARDREVQDGAFAVTREARMPAVLLELGFMSNPTELSKLRTTLYQRKLVNGIVTGIHNYFLI